MVPRAPSPGVLRVLEYALFALIPSLALAACDSGSAGPGAGTSMTGGAGGEHTTPFGGAQGGDGGGEDGGGEDGGAPCTVNGDFDRFTEIPPALLPPFDPATEIRVHDPELEAFARHLLIDVGFGGQLPSGLPLSIPPVLEDLEGLTEYASAEAWQSSYDTRMYLLHPLVPNDRAVIVHQGHVNYDGRFGAGIGALIDHLLDQGFTVAVLQMPARGWNTGKWDSHAEIIETLGEKALSELVGPVIEMVNLLHGEYVDVSMTGHSGGGWTTVLAAAVDPRITRSVPVSGSLPLRFQDAYIHEVCTYMTADEQEDFGFYEALTYEDLYLLGATAGRRQLQINSQNDNCCFYGVSSDLYIPLVTQAASGSWSFHLDSTHWGHKVSADAMVAIDAFLAE